MPNLLELRAEAVKNPTLYKSEVLSQKQALDARIELFKLQPGFQHEEMLDLFRFLNQMAKSYEELHSIPQLAFELVSEYAVEMQSQTRLSLLKFTFSDYFVFDKTNLFTFLELVVIKDKELRLLLQNILIQRFRKQITNEELDVLTNALQTQQNLIRRFLIRLFALIYEEKIIKEANEYEKIVNSVCYILIESNDKQIIKLALNFFTDCDKVNDMPDDDEEEDGPIQVVSDDQKQEEINKLMHKLKERVTKFSLDENRKKKDIDGIKKEIQKLYEKEYDRDRNQLFICDYLRDPTRFAEDLTKKFLIKESPFAIKLIVFEYVGELIARSQLVLSEYYEVAVKYLRPREENVTDILTSVVESFNSNSEIDDALLVIKQIVNEFINSSSSDEEMTIAITAVTQIMRRRDDIFVDKDNQYLINELVSYCHGKNVEDAHETAKSGVKTSARTRKGVINSARELLNYCRNKYPEILESKYLDKESAIRLQELKKNKATEEQNYSSYSDSEEEDLPSKHMLKKRREQIKDIFAYIKHIEKINEKLTLRQTEAFSKTLGYDINEDGTRVEYKNNSLLLLKGENDGTVIEEEFECEEEETQESDSEFCLDESFSEHYNPDMPIEEEKILTEEEIERFRKRKQEENDEVDLKEFVTRAKSTSEERREISKSSKDPSEHKSNFWNRKTEGKSRTNKEKQLNKPMMMVLHSKEIRQKLNRSAKEKDYVMRAHLRNEKRGITKKVKR